MHYVLINSRIGSEYMRFLSPYVGKEQVNIAVSSILGCLSLITRKFIFYARHYPTAAYIYTHT